MKFFSIMNHTLTSEQLSDMEKTFGITSFVGMPEDVAAIWADIPPDAETLASILLPVKAWLEAKAAEGDIVLIQGDFGAVHDMVNFSFSKKLVPVYATTQRDVVETMKEDGSIEVKRVFRHKRFRKYLDRGDLI